MENYELIKKAVSEYMEEHESEHERREEEISKHLSEKMTMEELKDLAAVEAASVIKCLGMGHVDKAIYEYEELEMVMDAICRHLPEGIIRRESEAAVDGYRKMYM